MKHRIQESRGGISKAYTRQRELVSNGRLGKNSIDCELKKLRDTVGSHAALTFVADESKTIGGFGRNDRFSYMQLFGGPGEVANRVLLEAAPPAAAIIDPVRPCVLPIMDV